MTPSTGNILSGNIAYGAPMDRAAVSGLAAAIGGIVGVGTASPTYPAYAEKPCDAFLVGPIGFCTIFNRPIQSDIGSLVCLESDAAAALALYQACKTAAGKPFFGDTLTLQEGMIGDYDWIYPSGDQRRIWSIVDKTSTLAGNCEALRRRMFAQGVGKPGRFIAQVAAGDTTKTPEPTWVWS